MDILIYVILPILGSIFIIYAEFFYMRTLGCNRQIHLWKQNLVIAVYIVISISCSIVGKTWINIIIIFLTPVIAHYIYNDSRLHLVYYFTCALVVYLTDLCGTIAISYLYNGGWITFIRAESYYIMSIITLRFAEFMALRIVTGIIRGRKREKISRGQLAATFLLPVFSVVNAFSMLIFLEMYMVSERMLIFGMNLLMLLVVNIYFTYIFDTIGRNNQLERELFLYQQQEQMQTAYYKSLEQKYTDTRKLVHDIRNHVEAMEALYLEQQSVRGIEYANDIHSMLNQLGQTFYTSNQMLNIVLNDKVEKMYQAGIEADIKISELPEPFMRDVDITTLFGNLLDNAIEAASECKGEETFVRLRVAAVHSFYTIHLENSSNEPRKKAGQMISGKKGHEGIGLGNISRVVGSYGGDIEYGWKDGVFFTNIMLEGGDV